MAKARSPGPSPAQGESEMKVTLPSSTPSSHANLLLDRYLVGDLDRLEKKDTPSEEEWRRVIQVAPPGTYKLAFERWKKLLPPTRPGEVKAPFVRLAREGQATGRFV